MKTVLITGATSGVGLGMAKQISKMGHHLILACRNMDKAKKILDDLKKATPSLKVDILALDLADIASIKQFSSELNEKFDSIDVLINNAGVFVDSNQKKKDGYDMTMGVNFLAQVLLTRLMIPMLKRSEHARIINISSEAALFGSLKVKGDLFTKQNKGFLAYSKSKLAQILFNIDLAQELKASDIIVNAVHPGKVATNIWQGESLMMKIMGPINMKKYMSPDQAAKIGVAVAMDDEYSNVTGKFYRAEGEMQYNKRCLDQKLRSDLMDMTNSTVTKIMNDK